MALSVPRGARLLEALGAGTFFEVALVEAAGRRCVCKRLRPRMRSEPAAVAALAREGEVLGRARHPSVPQLVAAGEDEAGPWLIESLVIGVSLRELVERWVGTAELVPLGTLRHIARAFFGALAELHALGDDAGPLDLSHGDIAPDHLLVAPARAGERGAVGFVDFGMARVRGMRHAPGADERGTLPYVAPEVARGAARPGQAGDVFALAASFAYAVLGREPCRGFSLPSVLVEVAEHGLELDALERRAEQGEPLCGALLRALSFEPERRVCSAAEVVELLTPPAARAAAAPR